MSASKVAEFHNPFPRTTEGSSVPVVRLVPLREKRELQLVWPLPSVRPHYRSCPTQLLSHLLGHEGEGSIYAQLHVSAVHPTTMMQRTR
eukprot:32030-Eustigmatos_ZCMA.PRE.1